MLVALVGFGFGVALATHAEGPFGAIGARVDEIIVEKGDRRLSLLARGEPIRSYTIALGARPRGHKQQQGDERTPEGRYVISTRNPESAFHLSLRISYPNDEDERRAQQQGVEPGGDIMIHGLPNGWGWVGSFHRQFDWTDGCIAVTNEEIEEIWSLVRDGTPIEIRP